VCIFNLRNLKLLAPLSLDFCGKFIEIASY
jgi:hypothetical protein